MQLFKKQTLVLMSVLTLFGAGCVALSAPVLVEAKIPSSKVPNIPKKTADQAAMTKILNGFYQIAGAVAVIIIIISGLRFITGGDNPETVATARRAIIYACAGLVVIVSAFIITQFVINVGST